VRTSPTGSPNASGQPLALHGWVYDVADGLLHDLDTTITGPDALGPAWRTHPPGG
jgi:carbonic anhydrase